MGEAPAALWPANKGLGHRAVSAREGFTLTQRFGGYDRKDKDAYQTPPWVTAAIVPHLRALDVRTVWEPACGDGQIVAALRDHGFDVVGTDITAGNDFLNGCAQPPAYDAIVSNSPGGPGGRIAHQFIELALEFTRPKKGAVVMAVEGRLRLRQNA
jgi:hypothetical protein